MFDKLKSIFQTVDITKPAKQSGFAETRALVDSSFQATQMDGDSSFGDTQFAPGQTNFYQCACGAQWDGIWNTTCNDACPTCGKDTAPFRSEPAAV